MGFHGHSALLPPHCCTASLSICTVGNPVLPSMGRSLSQDIVDVVVPMVLLHAIALSAWITVR